MKPANASPVQTCSFMTLPMDVQRLIPFDPFDLVRMQRVCKAFKTLSEYKLINLRHLEVDGRDDPVNSIKIIEIMRRCPNLTHLAISQARMFDSEFTLFVLNLSQSSKLKSFEYKYSIINNTKNLAMALFHLYQTRSQTLNLDLARQSPTEAKRSERGDPSLHGKGDEEDRLGKVAASPNSKFETASGIRDLEILALPGNDIGNENAQDLSSILPYLKGLKTLNLARNNFTFTSPYFFKTLTSLPQLEVFNFSNNEIKVQDGISKLRKLDKLRELNLHYCAINKTIARAIAAELPSQLRLLNISYNSIEDEGAVALAHELPRLSELRGLNLDSCAIKDTGVRAIAANLPSGLRKLTISWNPMTDVGANAVVNAIHRLNQLEEIVMKTTYVGQTTINALAAACREKKSWFVSS